MVNNRTLVRYGLRTDLVLLAQCKPECYFLMGVKNGTFA